MIELISPSQMALADRWTIENGTPGIELMESAGNAVVMALRRKYPDARTVLVACGPGNNGGDGFVAARLLAQAGIETSIWIVGNRDRISGDAALALERLQETVPIVDKARCDAFDVLVDALLGAGLDRPVEGQFAETIAAMNDSGKPVVAVDLPSGVDGKTGKVRGRCIRAALTVTFFRLKPGHVLFPGRQYCGEVNLQQIGIPDGALKHSGISGFHNQPGLWERCYPALQRDAHKYDRGHTLVVSGPLSATGAARLTAAAALRSGSGLVTMASSREALAIHAAHLTSVMLQVAEGASGLVEILTDTRINCVALGPGMKPDGDTREIVLTVLGQHRTTVLDAGALTAFQADPDALFRAIRATESDVFLTPHQGEFERLFGNDDDGEPSKLDRTHLAAEKSGATVVFKGPDTVVSTPNGQVCVADNAPPWLATAGSGDVLTGIVAGLAAQGLPAFEAASAAVWLQGEAANQVGPGLVSSDLDGGLKRAITNLYSLSS